MNSNDHLESPLGTLAPIPDLLPVLSRGRHRSPRRGGCFMEIASFLAGERWSDSPACTHPLLATLARAVNDRTSNASRHRLAPLIPSVIGVVATDPAVDVRLAMLCARLAIPLVSADRQQAMAAALRSGTKVLVQLGVELTPQEQSEVAEALRQVPAAPSWVRQLESARPASVKTFSRRIAPLVVERAVSGVAVACTADPDGALRDMLTAAVTAMQTWAPPGASSREVDRSRWDAACAVTGSVPAQPAQPAQPVRAPAATGSLPDGRP